MRIALINADKKYTIEFKEKVKSLGHAVDSFNGSSEFRIADPKDYNVILVDQHLPGIDGVTLVEGLKRISNVDCGIISDNTPFDLNVVKNKQVDGTILKSSWQSLIEFLNMLERHSSLRENLKLI